MKKSKSNEFFLVLARYFGVTLLIALASGCSTSFGPSTVELSRATTVRVKDLHQVHLESINQYFDFQEARIEGFIEREWTPLFLKNFVGISGIVNDINSVSRVSKKTQGEIIEALNFYTVPITPEQGEDETEEAYKQRLEKHEQTKTEIEARSEKITIEIASELTTSWDRGKTKIEGALEKHITEEEKANVVTHLMALLGTDEPAILIMEFSKEAHIQIDIQRNEMLEPIRKKRKEVLTAINDRYDEILAAQGIVTGRLEAQYKEDQASATLVNSVFGEGTDEKIREDVLGFGEKISDVLTKLSSKVSKVGEDVSTEDLVGIIKEEMAD